MILYGKPRAYAGIVGGKSSVYVAYVEPKPYVFKQLARLGKELQGRLNSHGTLNAEIEGKLGEFASAADRFAKAAEDELAGVPMNSDDANFCKDVGRLQKRLTTFGPSFSARYLSESTAPRMPSWPELLGREASAVWARALMERPTSNVDRTMTIVADVHTDGVHGLVLEEAVGGPCELYAVIPFYGKQYLAVGACYSYYEFTKPMSQRMTDEEWQALSPKPPMPVWTKSFIVAH